MFKSWFVASKVIVSDCIHEVPSWATRVVDYRQFHLRDLFVDSWNELKDKVNELGLVVLLHMVRWYQKRKVVAFDCGLFPQDVELVCTQGHKAFQHSSQKGFQLTTFFDWNWNSDTVDWCLNSACFTFSLRNDYWGHDQLCIVLELNFWMDLSFN